MRLSTEFSLQSLTVMRGLDPRIHVFAKSNAVKTWMPPFKSGHDDEEKSR